MKVLLTGATGYIGRRLKERLLEDESLQLRLFVRNERKIRDKYRDRVKIFLRPALMLRFRESYILADWEERILQASIF
jgi:thioester reductase-like protein